MGGELLFVMSMFAFKLTSIEKVFYCDSMHSSHIVCQVPAYGMVVTSHPASVLTDGWSVET